MRTAGGLALLRRARPKTCEGGSQPLDPRSCSPVTFPRSCTTRRGACGPPPRSSLHSVQLSKKSTHSKVDSAPRRAPLHGRRGQDGADLRPARACIHDVRCEAEPAAAARCRVNRLRVCFRRALAEDWNKYWPGVLTSPGTDRAVKVLSGMRAWPSPALTRAQPLPRPARHCRLCS
jgi:hypothetical protein